MRYAKLTEGRLTLAPDVLHIGSAHVWNAPGEEYLAQGWKPLAYTEAPEAPEGFVYISGWEERENAVVQTWTLAELPDEAADADYEAALNRLGVEV